MTRWEEFLIRHGRSPYEPWRLVGFEWLIGRLGWAPLGMAHGLVAFRMARDIHARYRARDRKSICMEVDGSSFCFIFSMRRMRRSSSGWHVRHIVFINILTILTIVNGILFLLYVLLFSLLQGAIRTDFRLVAPALSVVCDSV